MIEKNLEDFEEFYTEKINTLFSKIKRVLKKLILEIRDNLVEIKVCLDHFLEVGKEKIDQKSQKSLNLFSDRVRKEIDEIEVPEEEMEVVGEGFEQSAKDLLDTLFGEE